MSQRGVAFATAPRRLRGAVAATSLRRLHEPFIRSLRGPSRWVPRKTRNPFEPRRTIFTARGSFVWWLNPKCNLLAFAPSTPAEKADFWFWAPKNGGFSDRLKNKKSRRKIFLGGRKSYLAAEHHNKAAPKKKKNPRFFRLGAEKYCSLGARRKTKIGGAKFFWGGAKKLFGRRTPLRDGVKNKKTKKNAWAPKNTTLFRPPKERRPSNFLSRPS